MAQDSALPLVVEIMRDFSDRTGVTSAESPRRYLWTDAFALCNFLELFRRSGDEQWRDLALRLIAQVHGVLGRHREDDPRTGWISGLGEDEGERHPTAGGLRIGKDLSERLPEEPLDEQLEWDRDGQYFHYLTKWMHALNRAARVLGEPECNRWAMELAKTAHDRFVYVPSSGSLKRMYWKMSIDLTRPLVPTMGQHDPLDGLITFCRIQATAKDLFHLGPDGLEGEIADMAGICHVNNWATNDPLGIGGLLHDACRMMQLTTLARFERSDLLEGALDAARVGLEAFVVRSPFRFSAQYRLPFRELGLSIGLHGIEMMRGLLDRHPDVFGAEASLHRRIDALAPFVSLGEKIDSFWTDKANQESETWGEHREINMVMLATSLAPEGFLAP